MIGQPRHFIITVSGMDRTAAIGAARSRVYSQGWIKTHVANVEVIDIPVFAGIPPTKQKTIPGFRITIEVAERRGGEGHAVFSWLPGLWRLPRGAQVRTRVPGYNYVGGARHTMPAGSLGVIRSRIGPNLRVEFPEVPGHTFIYAPQGLERVGDEDRS
jgi:hypothetical protein